MTTDRYGSSPQIVAAHDAVRRGFHIFPCERDEKLPAYRSGVFQEQRIKWYDYATDDPLLVAQWWSYQPEFNIGVCCKKSGLLVVDCDMPKDDSTTTGVDQFHDLCRKYGASWAEATRTYQVSTPSGGRHFYYAWPRDVIASQRSLDTMIDVRTNGGDKGGYVVGAGSRIPIGWYRVVRQDPVKPCPQWLVKHVQAPPEQNTYTKADNFDRPYSPNFSGLHREITTAREGNRNHVLNWAVFKAVQGNPDLTLDQVEHEFTDSARQAGLTDSEIRATIRSAYHKAKR